MQSVPMCDVTGHDVIGHDVIGRDVIGHNVTGRDVTGCDVTGHLIALVTARFPKLAVISACRLVACIFYLLMQVILPFSRPDYSAL